MINPELIAEKSMEAFWDFKQRGYMAGSLGVLATLGYDQETIDFVLDPDSYYFPNKRGNTLVRPANVADEKIPVVALENGVVYQFEKRAQHRLQRIALRRAGFDEQTLRSLDTEFHNMPETISSSGGRKTVASVERRHIVSPLNNQQMVESRPVLIFNIEPGRRGTGADEPCAGVVAHEMTHLTQTLSDPIASQEKLLRLELEAYAVQAPLVSAWAVPYSMSNAAAGEVDAFRRKYLGENNYEPDEFFREQFYKEPMFATIGVSY